MTHKSNTLPQIPDYYYYIIDEISKYNIRMGNNILKKESIGTKRERHHQLFISPDYPEYLFYHTKDMTIKDSSWKGDYLGRVTNVNYYVRKMDQGIKMEVSNIFNKPEIQQYITYENLNILFNAGPQYDRSIKIQEFKI